MVLYIIFLACEADYFLGVVCRWQYRDSITREDESLQPLFLASISYNIACNRDATASTFCLTGLVQAARYYIAFSHC